MGHVGPTLKKIIKIKIKRGRRGGRASDRVFDLFFLFFIFSRFSLRYMEIGPSEFVGARTKMLYSMRATRGNQKHGISSSFQLKIQKILCFGFSHIYGFLTVRIGRSRRQN